MHIVFIHQPTDVKLAKAALNEALQTDDIGLIKTTLQKCQGMKMSPLDDDIAAAQAKLEFLKLKRGDCLYMSVKLLNLKKATFILLYVY